MPDFSLTHLNEQQKAAVTHQSGPLLIIAGAGTGKTTVITDRITYLIKERQINPTDILALTFTEKAAKEMEERIDMALPYGYTQLWVSTFHAFCDRVLRQEAIHIGLNPAYKIATEAEALMLLQKNIDKLRLDYFRPLGNPHKFLQGMLQHFSRLADDDITPENYMAFAEELSKRGDTDPSDVKKTTELAYAFQVYEALKAKEGIMDFANLNANALKLFRKRSNILKYYQEKFKYILVDEFQDTNYAQNELAILLAGERQNITVVGDDDQSIYRWRGAALANMMQFRSHFPKAKIITLTQNYRSTQAILNSAYQLIQFNNPDRLEVKEKLEKKLTAVRNIAGDPVSFIYTQRVEDEAEEVAKIIREEVKKNDRAYNEFAILVRANDHAAPFQRALERAKIPYQFLGPGHLFQQEEIKDLIAYLRVLANFEDDSCLYRVLTMQIFGIEARDIAALFNFAKKNNKTLFESMEQVEQTMLTESGKEKITKITTMLKNHMELIPREPAGQILYLFFEASGLLGHYLDPKTARTEKEAQNIAKFFDKLNSFTANREDASVFAIVDWIDLSMELGESPMAAEVDWTTNNAVNILTIHSSKGLEFPVVFVVNLVTQRFPSRDRKEQIPVPQELIREQQLPEGDENLQEERRLFYVAMTRAKEKLFLTAAQFYGEGTRERKLAPFITEALGDEHVKRITQATKLTQNSHQLSLLDLVNTTISQQVPEKMPKKEIPSLPPLTYISYSQIQTFQLCPLHYKLRYLLNVPTVATPALSYGISVHSTLKDFFQMLQSKEKVHAETIRMLLKKNWIKLGYVSKLHEEQTYNQADSMLSAFAQKHLLSPTETIAIELPFQFWINKLKVGGRIDRIDKLPDGRIEIIDYKTGSNVPDKKKLQEDLQLTFYALAATEVHDELLKRSPDEIVLTLHYLEENKRLSTTRTKDELLLAKEKIIRIAENIVQSDYQCEGSMFCKSCEYKMLCSTYSD
jgi:DNA helicase II / ATP-dependent DNA helicase PcrA